MWRPNSPPPPFVTRGLTAGLVLFIVFAVVLVWLGFSADMTPSPTTDHHATTTTSNVP